MRKGKLFSSIQLDEYGVVRYGMVGQGKVG